jgi:hypothetical protein
MLKRSGNTKLVRKNRRKRMRKQRYKGDERKKE